jgi:hypothetical protein
VTGFGNYYPTFQTAFGECCLIYYSDPSSLNGTYFVPLIRNCTTLQFSLAGSDVPPAFPYTLTLASGTAFDRVFCSQEFKLAENQPRIFFNAVNSQSFNLGASIGFHGTAPLANVSLVNLCFIQPSGQRQYAWNPTTEECVLQDSINTGLVKFSIVGGPTP